LLSEVELDDLAARQTQRRAHFFMAQDERILITGALGRGQEKFRDHSPSKNHSVKGEQTAKMIRYPYMARRLHIGPSDKLTENEHALSFEMPCESAARGHHLQDGLKYCYYKTMMLGTDFLFAAGSGRNGTGVYDEANGTNTVLKTYFAGASNVCPLTSGFDSAHTFFSVDAGGNPTTRITGAAGKTLSDGTGGISSVNENNPRPGSLAIDPCATNAPASAQSGCTSIVSPPVYLFSKARNGSSDSILLFDQNDTNDVRDLRLVQDLCSACKNQPPQQSSTPAHIDMYNGTNKSCSAGVVGEHGYYYAIRVR
jgi:hypothetical protein